MTTPQEPEVDDPIPDPEPSVPSLSEPDPDVFHHEPGTPESTSKD
jgi:hypothetical protein